MESQELEKNSSSFDDGTQLSRNRSFKSKQLVRSQAIREAQSPPRIASPSYDTRIEDSPAKIPEIPCSSEIPRNPERTVPANDEVKNAISSHASDVIDVSFSDSSNKKQPVEIQISGGAWEEGQTSHRSRSRRWLDAPAGCVRNDNALLSYGPRVACVCGVCACPLCRGRRRRPVCPTKQDSGISCSDDGPDGSDSEQTESNGDTQRKSSSLDVDDRTFYCRCPERKERPKNLSFSRTESEEKQEPTGPDLVAFIKETLNKNPRDRMTLLRIEKELHALVNDVGRCIVRFPVMTSYGRMLVHRCAALFQLSHHLDTQNKHCVLVSKSGTCGGRIPCTNFKQWCIAPFPSNPASHKSDTTNAKSILKRDSSSIEEGSEGSRSMERSKSLEQREKDYEKVRRRIFSTDNYSQDESQWPWLNAGPIKVLTPDVGRNKLLKVQSLESGSKDGPPRGAVSKSHSFGGYVGDTQQPRLLSRQGDLASSSWRLSPSSSGYKTLSLRSTDSVTPSPTGGASPEPVSSGESGAIVWAVTDLTSVPAGAVVIHPQTGRPLTNPDGTIYHFDPSNPPVLYDASVYVQNDQQNESSCDKRRGKLEKQHSFIDQECDCQPCEECRNKFCCDCRRNDSCQQKTIPDKVSQKQEQKSIPTSPSKNCYNKETTNQNTATELPTNHISHYEQTTNQKQETTNQQQVYEPTNQKPAFEIGNNPRIYEANTKFEPNNQRTFETRTFESNNRPQFELANQKPAFEAATNQRPPSEVSANQRPVANRLTNQESQEVTQYVPQQNYATGFRNDEITSPHQMPNQMYVHDMMGLQNAMAQAKITPVPIPDPNIRPISVTGMLCQAPVPQPYPLINQCRMEQHIQPVYQPIVQPVDEHKLAPSPQAQESTFRIDPSYPYPPVDYAAQCGACVDTNPMQHHRSYNMTYNQPELPPVMPPYSVPLLSQPHLHHYPYQEAMQWPNIQPMVPVPANPQPKLYLQEVYPVMQYPNMYPYNVVYPHQVIPQPYPICQPVYPMVDKPPEVRRNSITTHRQYKQSISGSSRETPRETPPVDKKPPYDEDKDDRQNSNEMAAKIQQIKEQMAHLNTREGERDGNTQRQYRARGTDDWKRRNSGNGILGSYPVNNYNNGRVISGSVNDDTQLNSAARAIVNSLRNMQAKNTANENRRQHEFQQRNDYRPDYRRRERPDRDNTNQDRPNQSESLPNLRHPTTHHPNGGPVDKQARIDFNRRNNMQMQYRPPYLLRQMSPGTWCRRSPGPVQHPLLNPPRRPHPDTRNCRR